LVITKKCGEETYEETESDEDEPDSRLDYFRNLVKNKPK
jgi:hypothetical protein